MTGKRRALSPRRRKVSIGEADYKLVGVGGTGPSSVK